MTDPNFHEIGFRAHANRELLRQAPAAISTAVQMLRRDLVEETFEDGRYLSSGERDAVLALIEMAAGNLYDCSARVVGEDDHDLSKLYEGQAGGEK